MRIINNEASIKFKILSNLCPSHAPPRIAHNIHWNNHYYKILSEDMTWHRVAKMLWSLRANMIISRLHKSEKHVASDPRAPRCFSANTFSPLHRSINHKPLSIAFGLKDKNGDRVLTINSEEHVISHL